MYQKEAEASHSVKVASEEFVEYLKQKLSHSGTGNDTISQKQMTDNPENQDLADERCLRIYLQSHQNRLIDCDISSSSGVSQTVQTVQEIYKQLQTRKIGIVSGDRNCYVRKDWNSSQKFPLVILQIIIIIKLML